MSYADPMDCYQHIGSLLAGAVPEAWRAIEVEALLDEASVDLLITYTATDGGRKNLPYVPMLAKAFYDLALLVSNPEKGLYKKCLFKVTSDGDFKVDFKY